MICNCCEIMRRAKINGGRFVLLSNDIVNQIVRISIQIRNELHAENERKKDEKRQETNVFFLRKIRNNANNHQIEGDG